jgi:type II secretory pathway component GspD/PulD (secretin)
MPPGFNPGRNRRQPGQFGRPGETGSSEPKAETPGKPDEPGKGDKGSKNVQRPATSPVPPNPDELKINPDEKGKVRFNFNGQPWQGVLEWLARVSKMSLDWQELPDGFLNLNTQRSYTVEEARDLINSHLLARGFTLLRQGEVLHVVNIEKLDPSLVPRVAPADLERRDPHEFVKVLFALDSMLADVAVDEFSPMISKNGKLTALDTSNRLEARDAVVNLREIYNVLKEEQSGDSKKSVIREFVLKHARASDVKIQLLTLLGVEQKPEMPAGAGGASPDQAQQQAMMMAMQQQMQQQGGRRGQRNGGQPGQPPGSPAAQAKSSAAASSVALVVNDQKNSVLARATPDKMAIIVQAIEVIDVPNNRGQALVGNMSRMQVYRLVGVDPEPVVKTLQEIGNLDPTTRLEVDKNNKAIIAYASLADHVTIRAVVAKLSGSERSFCVRRLRHLQADYVAGTIAYMLGIQPKKQQKEQRWSPWSSPSRDTTNERPNEFRLDADLEHNRLLMWANEIEMTEVDNLLVKLGEIAPKGTGAENKRTIDAGSPEEAEELLKRLRQQWPSIAPNRLLLPPSTPKSKEPKPAPLPMKFQGDSVSQPPRTTATQSGDTVFRLVADGPKEVPDLPVLPAIPAPAKSFPAPKNSEEPPPVTLSVDADGKITISSDDTEALDRLQELAAELSTPRKEYHFFRLKYAWAYGVAQSLEEFFKDDNESKQKVRRPWYWDDYDSSNDSSDDDRRLSKRRKLKFLSDSDTNSILVQGADAAQLATISELIKIFDQKPPKDTGTERKTEIFRLRFAKAGDVADAVKDVYRDLLSSNDKALTNNQQQQRGGGPRMFLYDYGDDSSGKSEQKTPKFKGLLSIGKDDTSNTLVVSAPASLFDQISKLIVDLDEAAADNTVRVVKVGRGISAARMQEVLNSVLNQGSAQGSGTSKRSNRQRSGEQQPAEKTGQTRGQRPPMNPNSGEGP